MSQLESVTLGNVPESDPALLSATVACYIVYSFALFLLYREFSWFTAHRHKFLSEKRPDNYTVYVKFIPSHLRSNEALLDYFRSIFGREAVLDARMAYEIPSLEKAVADRDLLCGTDEKIGKLEHAINVLDVKGQRPRHKKIIVPDVTKANPKKGRSCSCGPPAETVDSIQQLAIKANVASSEMVKLLVRAGANPLEKDVRGVSLVHWAAGAGNLDGLVELIDFLPGGIEEALELRAGRDGASPLHWASAGAKSKEFGCGGHIDVVRFFLGKCPQENTKAFVNKLTKDGNSVLMWAAWSGSLEVCKLLVRNRADTSVANRNRCTVAHWAASGGNLEVCKYLHDVMKVDFTANNFAGNTPLSHAVAYGRADVVEWLRNEVCTDDDDGRAEDLALDFVKWTEGDSDRMKVYDLFNNDDWGL